MVGTHAGGEEPPTSTPRGLPHAHDDAWLDAFEAQLTPALYRRAKRYAELQARKVARAGGPVDALYAKSTVVDAITDTFVGTRRWDPAQKSLELHVRDTLRSRAWHAWRQAVRRPRLSIDDHAAHFAAAETALAGFSDPETDEQIEATSDELLRELYEHAKPYPEVVRLFDAYKAGATKKAEVMQHARMTSRVYERACRRLHRIVDHLSPELRAAARKLA